MDQKQSIIGEIMSIWFHQIKDWNIEDVKNFCKFIFDCENIPYTNEDFDQLGMGGTDIETLKLISNYAQLYINQHEDSSIVMSEIVEHCKQIEKFSNAINLIFSNSEQELPQRITIKNGESIEFSNGSYNNLTQEELSNLLELTFSENRKKRK